MSNVEPPLRLKPWNRWSVAAITAMTVFIAFILWVAFWGLRSRELPKFLDFLSVEHVIAQSIERTPRGYSEDLPGERSIEKVYHVSFEVAALKSRSYAASSPFAEESFSMPTWIVFRSKDGRLVALIPGNRLGKGAERQDRSFSTVLYTRPATPLEALLDMASRK